MKKLDELREMIKQDFDKATEPEQVKKLSTLNALVEDVGKENAELLSTLQTLKEEYVKSVKSQVVSKTPNQPTTTKERSMKQIVEELGLKDKVKL